jgi:ketosteroid isomerase-like protein
MDRTEMVRLFEAHREAEAARDIDAILETFIEDCFLETMPLGLRSEGRDAVRTAYEQQFFTAFPDLAPDDKGIAYNDEDDFVVVWGPCAEPAPENGSECLRVAAAFLSPSPTSFRSAKGS